MIIEKQEDVTKAVLAELQRAPNARFNEIMSAFVRHLHDFAREVKLTEEEFREAMRLHRRSSASIPTRPITKWC